jgi:hypothetical protein
MLAALAWLPVAAQGAELDRVFGRGDVIRLERHEEEIRVDGALDEPVWGRLPVYGDFFVTEPDTLDKPVHDTRVRMFYSSKGLYVGVEADQPPETLIARLSGRDSHQSRDTINLSIDTSGTGRYGFYFSVALGGSISDGTILPERQFSFDWDGPWRRGTKVLEGGWSAEFLIPWGTVAMPHSDGVRRMGIYVSRIAAYRNESYGWPGLAQTRPVFMSALQPLEVTDINPRQQYNFYPYASVTFDEVEGDTEVKAGADFFWRPSPNFQLNATLNPDFGAVESDEVVINLTATETFFPEKRLFFQEGQQIFNATPRADTRGPGIGNRGAPYTMVNTRRIGGKPESPDVPDDVEVDDRDLLHPVDLLGAAKATGQMGAFRYGVLGAFEDDASLRVTDADGTAGVVDQRGNDYGVARLLWESNAGGRYRGLGVLGTAVKKGVEGDAYAVGLDWHYYTLNAKLKMDGQAIVSDIEGTGQGFGGFMDFDYTHRQGLKTRVGIEYFDNKIDINDLGFLQRNDHWQVRVSHQRTTSSISFGRQNSFDIRGGLKHNLDGELVESGMFLSDELTLHSLHRLWLSASYRPRQYDDLNSFGNGTFRKSSAVSAGLGFATDSSRPLALDVSVETFGEDVGGQSWGARVGLDWRPTDRFKLGGYLGYQDRDGWLLHTEDNNMTTFQAEQVGPILNAEYFISARQQLRLALQWVGIKAREDRFYQIPSEPADLIEVDKPPGDPDDFSISQLSFQARYRWEIAPLSDLFVVYTRLGIHSDPLLDESFGDLFDVAWNDPIDDLFIVKLRYRFGT